MELTFNACIFIDLYTIEKGIASSLYQLYMEKTFFLIFRSKRPFQFGSPSLFHFFIENTIRKTKIFSGDELKKISQRDCIRLNGLLCTCSQFQWNHALNIKFFLYEKWITISES